MRVALLTAGHLSSCPRLIKEAKLLSKSGYKITIVYLESIPRISKLDYCIIEENPNWEFVSVKWENTFQNFLSKILYQLVRILNIKSDYIQSTSRVLIKTILNIKADLYIAHHPSVLVAAALSSKKYNAKYSYDIEDAFPYIEDGRFLENPDSSIFILENKYIKGTAFTTTASPLYSDLYCSNYKLIDRPINLLNVFDVSPNEIEYKDRKDLNKVSLYWYSQTVGLNRGLQDLFSAVNYLPINSFELHIRGNYEEDVRKTLISLVNNREHRNNIFFHDAVSIDELENRNKEHDIGFAIEQGSSLNRELCISNKIFDYLRSGLMIVATNTSGHQLITKELQNESISYTHGDVDTLSKELKKLVNDSERIRVNKQRSLQLAKEKYNWTQQSIEFIEKIKSVLY